MAGATRSGSWWQTLPGIFTGIGAVIVAVTGLIGVLHQAGFIGGDSVRNPDAPVDARPAESRVEPPVTGDPQELLASLRKVNIGNSVGDKTVLTWLADPDRRYRRLADACLAVIGNRRIAEGGADLDKINYLYLKSIGVRDGDEMPADHKIDEERLRAALVEAFNDKNGTNVKLLRGVFPGSRDPK